MSKYQPVRGTTDLFFNESELYREIESLSYEVCTKYGYSEMKTPIFEFSDVFHRSLGETSDMVSKETYTFNDRGGDSITLRPEGTAGVCRAFVSNGLAQELPLKFFYSGPMFRYERPQKGRQRQFHQIGIEALGYSDFYMDVETIKMGYAVLKELGLQDCISLKINSLGDKESRLAHREKLVSYLQKYKNDLSEESKVRLEKNPLRILDSKDEKDKLIVKDAPKLSVCLNSYSKKFFDDVLNGLTYLSVPFSQDDQLVRGIDYYTHTVFEFITDQLGAQGAVLSGGRYDGLIEQLGGANTSGIGWAAGIERLILLKQLNSKNENLSKATISIAPMSDAETLLAMKIAEQIRDSKISCQVITSGNFSKKMKKAEKLNSKYLFILGEDEVKNQNITIKNLSERTQQVIAVSSLNNFVYKLLQP